MKKMLLICVLVSPFGVALAQSASTTSTVTTTQAAPTADQNSENAFSQSWRWTKRTAQNVGENTGDALQTGWGWTKSHAIGIGRGFKEGGSALYKGVTSPPTPKKNGDAKTPAKKSASQPSGQSNGQ